MSPTGNAQPKWLREPLVHFVLIGAALFAGYSYFAPAADPQRPSTEIRLTPEEVLAMGALFRSQWQRLPTSDEFDRMVENTVQQEVLYREALAMGLDKDDTIVKRRMAQKLQFLAEDTATAHEPTSAELETWYAKNAEKFTLPGRISFRQVYFSPDKRGAHVHEDAEAALAKLIGQPIDAAPASDQFMLQDYYADRTSQQLAKEFGPAFAQAVFRVATGAWQGPIESGFGWHLVFVDSFVPGRRPDFAEIEGDVRTAWLGEQKDLAWRKAYEEMRAKYTVVLPVLPEPDEIMRAMPMPASAGDDVAPL